MRNIVYASFLTLAHMMTPVCGANPLSRLPAVSAEQAARIVTVLAAGSADSVALFRLPAVPGRNITNLAARTGIHRIEPDADEDYLVFSAMVGSRRITQFYVTSMSARSHTVQQVACVSRTTRPGCNADALLHKPDTQPKNAGAVHVK